MAREKFFTVLATAATASAVTAGVAIKLQEDQLKVLEDEKAESAAKLQTSQIQLANAQLQLADVKSELTNVNNKLTAANASYTIPMLLASTGIWMANKYHISYSHDDGLKVQEKERCILM
ncbi:MAG: hypothetical protein ACHP65_00480 [Legionellales bacterium]